VPLIEVVRRSGKTRVAQRAPTTAPFPRRWLPQRAALTGHSAEPPIDPPIPLTIADSAASPLGTVAAAARPLATAQDIESRIRETERIPHTVLSLCDHVNRMPAFGPNRSRVVDPAR